MKFKSIIIGVFMIPASLIYGQIDPVNGAGIAIGGYDVVSYFNSGKAIKGNKNYKSKVSSGTYYFSTAGNKEEFDRNPSRYLPQYEGFCALAVSYGKKISIDPETFKIIDDKLYLFYHSKTLIREVNSLETWNKNEDKLLKKANELWSDVKKRKYIPEEEF